MSLFSNHYTMWCWFFQARVFKMEIRTALDGNVKSQEVWNILVEVVLNPLPYSKAVCGRSSNMFEVQTVQNQTKHFGQVTTSSSLLSVNQENNSTYLGSVAEKAMAPHLQYLPLKTMDGGAWWSLQLLMGLQSCMTTEVTEQQQQICGSEKKNVYGVLNLVSDE